MTVMVSDKRSRSRTDLSAAQLRRDVVLARVARARRTAIIGAGALTAVLAGVVGVLAPGRSSAKAKPTPSAETTATSAHAGATMPPLVSPSQLGLQPPGSVPQAPAQTQTQAAPAPAAPVSGGS